MAPTPLDGRVDHEAKLDRVRRETESPSRPACRLQSFEVLLLHMLPSMYLAESHNTATALCAVRWVPSATSPQREGQGLWRSLLLGSRRLAGGSHHWRLTFYPTAPIGVPPPQERLLLMA